MNMTKLNIVERTYSGGRLAHQPLDTLKDFAEYAAFALGLEEVNLAADGKLQTKVLNSWGDERWTFVYGVENGSNADN